MKVNATTSVSPYSVDLSDTLFQAGMGIITHPLAHARILQQLGHEPLQPVKAHTALSLIGFGERCYCYPNIFHYWGAMRNDIGIVGIFFNGLPARLMHFVTYNISNQLMLQKYRGYLLPPNTARDPTMNEVLNEIAVRSFARVVALVASYPLYVVCVRQMAQVISKDDIYGNVFQTVGRIWMDEGVLGFYGGFTARVVGDVLSVVLTTTVTFAINKYLLKQRVAPDVHQHTPTVSSILVGSYTYKFNVISTVMAVAGSKLGCATSFKSSLECYHAMALKNALGRGSSLVLRYVAEPY